jgi:hypothetical protein
MPDRCTPEYERVLAKMGALLPYRRAWMVLSEFLPLGKPQTVETTRRRTLCVGARLEREAVTTPASEPVEPAPSITLSIEWWSHKGCTSIPSLAQISKGEGKPAVFSSVPAEAHAQTRQLRGVLHGLSATSATPATILSNGAAGPRSLGEAASPGPTHHVLDWFHLAMRIQHPTQAAKSWPGTTEDDRQDRQASRRDD